MLNEIRKINCSFAKDFYKSLRKRAEERRNKGFDFDKDLDMTLIKSELKALILRFAKGPEINSVSLDLGNSTSDEEKLFDDC